MFYDHVADVPFESLDALNEFVDEERVDVDCLCQSLWSQCPTLSRTILDAFLQDIDAETILFHSYVRLDDMDVGPNDVLNISGL